MINLIPIGKRGENGGLNIVSPTGNNFPIGNNDLVLANNFRVILPASPLENTLIYFLILENPCLVFGKETITLNSQVEVASFKIGPQGFIIPLIFRNSRWNILSSYISDIVLSNNFINLSNYQSPGDNNGIIYYLGTTAINSSTFSNPVPTQVVATSSGVDTSNNGALHHPTDRNTATLWHGTQIINSAQFYQLDFKDQLVSITRIVMRPRGGGASGLRPTIVEGSNDSITWTNIYTFTSEAVSPNALISPELTSAGLFRYIRFRRNDLSEEWWYVFSEIELYGFLLL
jgi:hypothetical protein